MWLCGDLLGASVLLGGAFLGGLHVQKVQLGGALLDALEGLGRLGRRRGLLQAGLHRGTGALGRAHGPAFFLVDGDDDLARAVQLLELVQLLARGLRGRGGGLAHGGALGAGWTRGAHHCRVGSCFLVLDDARFTTLSAPLLLPEGDVLPLLQARGE